MHEDFSYSQRKKDNTSHRCDYSFCIEFHSIKVFHPAHCLGGSTICFIFDAKERLRSGIRNKYVYAFIVTIGAILLVINWCFTPRCKNCGRKVFTKGHTVKNPKTGNWFCTKKCFREYHG